MESRWDNRPAVPRRQVQLVLRDAGLESEARRSALPASCSLDDHPPSSRSPYLEGKVWNPHSGHPLAGVNAHDSGGPPEGSYQARRRIAFSGHGEDCGQGRDNRREGLGELARGRGGEVSNGDAPAEGEPNGQAARGHAAKGAADSHAHRTAFPSSFLICFRKRRPAMHAERNILAFRRVPRTSLVVRHGVGKQRT